MKFSHFFTALISGLIPLAIQAADGVPDVPINYDVSVEAWWKEHPLNPAGPGGKVAITSPDPAVKVSPGNGTLREAINALPESGGTLTLTEGIYEGGFEICNRSNIHLIGEGENVIIRGSENFVLGSKLNHEYGEFCEAAFRKEPEATATLRELPTHNIYFKNLTFAQSPVRLASCRAVLFDDCTFLQEENRDIGAVDSGGKKVLRWYRPLPVTGIMGLQGIWFRSCDFQGHHANAYYLDGVQGSGAIQCRFTGVDQLWHNAILLFTNDDCSLDVNANDQLDPWERRDVRYYVVDGCTFGKGYKRGAIAASGRDILAQNCVVEGPLDSFMVLNAKTSGKDIAHECFGVVARNNQLKQVNKIITAEGASDRPEKGIPDWWVWTKYEIGRFTIVDNLTGPATKPLHELPRDSEILGPHQIKNNGPDVVLSVP